MFKKLMPIPVLFILVTSALVGCGGSPTPSTLTILSITEGNVFVMKSGTDSWTEAQAGMSLEAGDSIKTGDSSSAEITFFDGSTIELEAGTEIEITSLDISTDTGATTITLMQTIGTTISRVTKLLDPASSYEVETPTGVAAVRGSTLIVCVIFGDVNYEDGTTWITNQEGNIWFIGQGVELQIPEGRTCIVISGQPPEFIPLNNPPVAVDDTATTLRDTPITIDVLNNDSDSDGDTLTVDSVTQGTNGSVTNNGNNITYTPGLGFTGTDSFTYTISDGNSGTNTATVTVTVTNPNNPPVAVDDTATTLPYTPVTIDVLNNDSDSDGDTLTVDSVTQGTNGSVTNNGSNVTYTPAFSFAGIDSFTYTISDGKGGTDTATVTVTITVTVINVNNPPVAVDDSATTPEDISVTINVLNNDSDPDGDMLTVDSVTQGTSGSVTNNGSNVTYTPGLGFNGTDSFNYTISDGNGGTDTATVTVTITNVNNPPVAVDDSATTPQGTPVTIDVLNNDYDPDGDTLTVNSVTQGTNGSVTNNGSNVTYTPDVGFNGTDSFTYTISDGNGGTDTATVTVTVTVISMLARINVQIDTGATVSIYIWDNTTNGWATDEDTQQPVDGTNHGTPDTINVVGGHYYSVWVKETGITYNVKNYPNDWTVIIISTPEGDYEAACGYAAAGSNYPVHFSIKSD